MVFTITLAGLRMHACHGVTPEERRTGGEYSVDLTVEAEAREPLDDDVANTVSYADLYEIVAREMGRPAALLETVAVRIAEAVRASDSRVISGCVAITKLRPPIPGCQGSATVTLKF